MKQQADKIISDLITTDQFKSFVKKIKPIDLQDDLISEVSLILLEKHPVDIVSMHNNKVLMYYTFKIITNLSFSSTSSFYKKYKHYHVEINDEMVDYIPDDNSLTDILNLHQEALDEIEKLYWYDAEMVKSYIKHGNFRAVQKETNIPFPSCYKTIKKAIEQIKNKVYEK